MKIMKYSHNDLVELLFLGLLEKTETVVYEIMFYIIFKRIIVYFVVLAIITF